MITDWVWQGQSGDFSYEYERNYTRQALVTCDSVFDQEPDIYFHPECPAVGKSRPLWDPLAVCKKVKATYRKNSRWLWDLEAEYGTIRPTPYVPGQNPLQDPASVTVSSEISMEERYTDLDGLPCTNSAGDLVQVKIGIPRITFKIQKNVALVNGWLSQIAGVVNDSPVRLKGVLYPRGTLQVWSVNLGDVQQKNDIDFFVCDLTVKHRAEGWDTTYLNTGLNELRLHPLNQGPTTVLFDKAGKPLMIKQKCLDGPDGNSGDPITHPVFLDKTGQRPRSTAVLNNKPIVVIKDPLELKDIVVIKRRFLNWLDFNNRLPIR